MEFLVIFLNTLGMTLGVGSSTYAITFFHQSIADGVINTTEKRFLHTVYFFLRSGMFLLFASYIVQGYQISIGENALVSNSTLAAQATFLALILANAVLMDRKLIAMWLGPAIAGASWYGTFFAFVLDMYQISYPILMLWYGLFIILFIIILRILREIMLAPQSHS